MLGDARLASGMADRLLPDSGGGSYIRKGNHHGEGMIHLKPQKNVGKQSDVLGKASLVRAELLQQADKAVDAELGVGHGHQRPATGVAEQDHRLGAAQRPLNAVLYNAGLNVPSDLGAEIRKQLDRASLSVLLNIAEGNGKRQQQTRAKFFDDARGSTSESAACLDALVAKGVCSNQQVADGKQMLQRVFAMLTKLIQRFDRNPPSSSSSPGSSSTTKIRWLSPIV